MLCALYRVSDLVQFSLLRALYRVSDHMQFTWHNKGLKKIVSAFAATLSVSLLAFAVLSHIPLVCH